MIDRTKAGKRAFVPVRADVRRTLIWTADASRGLVAPGDAVDAYGQTWHLPVDESRPTYEEFVGDEGIGIIRDEASNG